MADSTLRVIGSGSTGNAYVLTAGDSRLILEAGINIDATLAALDYNLDGVCGVLVSHAHKDHAKYIPKYAEYFSVYSNSDVAEHYDDVKTLQPKKTYRIGDFQVVPLEVEHGVPNYAYMIFHVLTGWICFCTDAVSFPYKLKHPCITALIECNYVEAVVLKDALNGHETHSQVGMHMELSETIKAVERLKNPLMRNVILCHLSCSNSDRKIITERFREELDIEPKFATKGAIFNINELDF